MHPSTNESASPRERLALRRSLGMGLLCALAGLGFGIWVGGPPHAGKGWSAFIVTAPLAAFSTGTVFWLLLVARQQAPSRTRGILAGVLTGVVGHYLCWYLMILYQDLRFLLFNETSSLGEPPLSPLGGILGAAAFTFWSMIIVGWLTAPLGGLLGLVTHHAQFRKSRKSRKSRIKPEEEDSETQQS